MPFGALTAAWSSFRRGPSRLRISSPRHATPVDPRRHHHGSEHPDWVAGLRACRRRDRARRAARAVASRSEEVGAGPAAQRPVVSPSSRWTRR